MERNANGLMQPVIAALKPGLAVQLIVIDGRCGSGKSTLARALSEKLHAPVIRMDDFFLPFSMRTGERLLQPGGNVHYERFAAQVLPFAGQPDGFSYQRFHCDTGAFSPVECRASAVRIVEGTYSLHPSLLPAWQAMQAVTVFLTVDEREQLRRLAKRNPGLLDAFREKWIPMEEKYFSAFSVAEKAAIRLISPGKEGENGTAL